MISSTKAKPVPMSEEDGEIVAKYGIHEAQMEEQQKINQQEREERSVVFAMGRLESSQTMGLSQASKRQLKKGRA